MDWTVKAMTPDLAATQWAAMACCIPGNQTLHIRPDLTPQQQASALIHEVIHACFHAFFLPEGNMSEEDVCSRLEVPLTNVVRDNPKLFEALRKALLQDKRIV
ncbi:MAG: hypothetical protein V4457_12900 [Pseudomonadota bacterium]